MKRFLFDKCLNLSKKNQDKSYGKGIVFRASSEKRHMVEVPLMDEAADFLSQMMAVSI